MPDLPSLAFLPVKDLLIHERHDSQRTRPLVLRIRASGVWRNPPIVAPMKDGSGRYMVLDGANRITALEEMEYPHALVQVVQPDDPGLDLQNWNHVVWELNEQRFLAGVQAVDMIELAPQTDPEVMPNLGGECGVAILQTCSGARYQVCASACELVERVNTLNAIVDSYKDRARLDRTVLRDVAPLEEIYPTLCGLVIFPTFRIQELMHLAGQGYLLPAGITRFTISPRALHLNYPLEELSSHAPVEEKNERLFKWLKERVAKKTIRYYAEPTFLFDE